MTTFTITTRTLSWVDCLFLSHLVLLEFLFTFVPSSHTYSFIASDFLRCYLFFHVLKVLLCFLTLEKRAYVAVVVVPSLSRVQLFVTPGHKCSTPGSPVLHCLLQFAQIHVLGRWCHLVLCRPLLLLPSVSSSTRILATKQPPPSQCPVSGSTWCCRPRYWCVTVGPLG